MQHLDTHFLPPEAGSSTFASWRGSSLPPDLLAGARRRVRLFALLMTFGMLVPFLLIILFDLGAEFGTGPRRFLRWMQLGIMFFSLDLYIAARWKWWTDERVLALGLFYEVILCFIANVTSHWFDYATTGVVPIMTWATVIIAVYPMVVPTRPTRALGVSVAAALTAPGSVALGVVLGVIEPLPWDWYLGVTISPAISCAFAVAGATVIHGLGREVATARRLGSYHLIERLGEGAMGEVWLGRHDMLARPAAVKLMRTLDVQDPGTAIQRFEREAKATANLKSAHTVALYDFGRSADGTIYYVMEALDGVTLQSLVESYGPLPPERVVHVLMGAADSLAEAHEAALVHRDIKPANIMVCRYGRDYDFVKVLDFGLVALRRDQPDGAEGLTVDGAIQGTPAYMAPEVARGHEVDHRADLYSLGCVAYWLLTGRLVFEGQTAMDVILAHVHDTPIRPSSVSETPIPPELEATVMACLAKDPAERPRSAEELMRRLSDCDLGEAWRSLEARRWWETVHPSTRISERVPINA